MPQFCRRMEQQLRRSMRSSRVESPLAAPARGRKHGAQYKTSVNASTHGQRQQQSSSALLLPLFSREAQGAAQEEPLERPAGAHRQR